MRSEVFSFVLCFSCVFVAAEAYYRMARAASGPSGGSSSYSSSSSSSSSGGSGFGNPGGFFQFPTAGPYFPYHNPAPVGFPVSDFNQMFQQFVSNVQTAQSFASQNPAYARIFEQQMSMLASLQQMALAQYPFAFPGFDLSNSVNPEIYGQGTAGVSPGVGGTRTGGYGSGYKPGGDSAVYTSGSVNYGPHGGQATASAAPGGPDGLGVRISEEFPAPSGPGSFGTFSSSSSGVSSVNGKTTSFKTSTVGVNDNGKITFRTVRE